MKTIKIVANSSAKSLALEKTPFAEKGGLLIGYEKF